jgi:hypothetical protein
MPRNPYLLFHFMLIIISLVQEIRDNIAWKYLLVNLYYFKLVVSIQAPLGSNSYLCRSCVRLLERD